MRYKCEIFSILSLVNCATGSNGEIGFCLCNTCSENEGDCYSHDQCQDGLVCGSNNCPNSLGFDSDIDCCSQSSVGSEDYCVNNLCGDDEGDCDSNSECQSNHFCGSNNCADTLGFDSGTDCCSSTQIMSPNYPNLYPNKAYETWKLTASTGSIIILHFLSFYVRLFVNFKSTYSKC